LFVPILNVELDFLHEDTFTAAQEGQQTVFFVFCSFFL